jgi:hypothetical protein
MDDEASTKGRDLLFNRTCQQKYRGLFSREPAVLANLWKVKI